MYALGQIDATLDELARRVGISQVSVPFVTTYGPWSFGLKLMRTVNLVHSRADRWTLSEHVLDRLHGGGMNTGVIRRGKAFRERLHEHLRELWEVQAHKAEEVAHA